MGENQNRVIRFIDLFAGIGGFRYGLTACNRKQQKDTEAKKGEISRSVKVKQSSKSEEWRNYTCVWSNDFDKYAAQIYKKHYGECDQRDITTVPAEEIPDHDLICAGFPCQSFSIAGKRKGFDDTRGTLFYEICRIARHHRTPYLLLENVKGLLNHDQGQTFSVILESLDELGYDCQWQVLNSKDFGVPQNRERVLIVGHLRGTSRPEVFPLQKLCEEDSDLATESIGNGNRTWGGTLRKEGTASFGSGDIFITDETRIRRLTPTECERLQGFPDDWTEGISDTQRYKCLGNAVTTNVITEIGKQLRMR